MSDLFFGQGTGHSIMLLAFVIAVGLLLGKIRIKGVSLGSTWILFVGILLSHFGFRADSSLLHFLKEFGLILFVFSIGLQVGPGFFHSFKSGGLKLNMLAVALVLIGVITTYVIHLVTKENLVTLTGVMSGAVTNTPGLGAAQQTYLDATAGSFIHETTSPDIASSLASGYAVAYPIGVLGVILVLMLTKALFRVDLKKEEDETNSKETGMDSPQRLAFCIKNPAVFGKTILEASHAIENKFIISRVYRNGAVTVPVASTVLHEGDDVLVVTAQSSVEAVTMLFGEQIDMPKEAWDKIDASMEVRKLTITRTSMTGKRLKELKIRTNYGVSITRVNRGGIDLVANPDLIVQMGDSLLVVGHDKDINQVAKFVGNSRTGLNHPNLIPIFFGIALGVLFGSIPIAIPGIPQAIKFGLAGGPLIIAILLGYFGPKLKITTYTTMSANLMLREIGISVFLAAVGLGAGENFVSSIVNGGYWWILYGALITLIPTALVAILGRAVFKLNFYQICGLVSGSCTNPPVLAFAQNAYGTDYTSVSYATVYPLAMFMRVLVAQILILIAVA
ncbi:MAG: putative transporter [Bacteroidetes bacterium]|uniref:Transporter n=1 Tax=Candidatus Cryptobacteroides excrementavium TaxID=2840759 RepID=A0A9D9NS22_9BACT|nr:putative transporter [Candidatus Cryptobacteroides excrementavium]